MSYACKAAAVAALTIALILPAAASAQENFPEPDLRPLRQWSMSETTTAGLGFDQVDGETQQGGRLLVSHDFGETTFDTGFDGLRPDGLATGRVFSSASGQTFKLSTHAPTPTGVNDPDARIGNRVVLDQWQAFEKEKPDAKLRFLITDAFLRALDSNGETRLKAECRRARSSAARACWRRS
jgi:hypothetical protein